MLTGLNAPHTSKSFNVYGCCIYIISFIRRKKLPPTKPIKQEITCK